MTENKKIFVEPELHVERFAIEDVLTTSVLKNGWDTDAYAFDEDQN